MSKDYETRKFLFWYDPWLDGVALIQRFHPTIISVAESSSTAKVEQFVQNRTWALPTSNHRWITEMRSLIASIDIGTDDAIIWDGKLPRFVSMATIWNSIRERGGSPPWVKAVWHGLAIPKCSFTLWLALKNRLLTKDRMLRFGMSTDSRCILCKNATESNGHLFGNCIFVPTILADPGYKIYWKLE